MTTAIPLAVASIALALVPLRATPASAAPSLPFQEDTVITGLDNPTAVRFSPDGRVFVAEKSGLIQVYDSLSDASPTEFADLTEDVHNYWDRGLLGLELDPDFPTDPYLYVLYTYNFDPAEPGIFPRWEEPGEINDPCPTPPGPTGDGCVVSGRLSRLTASGNTTIAEKLLVEDWCQQYPSHSVGSLAFGADGALYASAGEGANFDIVDRGQDGNPVNPCGDPPGGSMDLPTAEGGALRSQDLRSSGDPVTLDGTIIRIDPETGDAMPGNPLAGNPDPNAERIVAHGFRNPFRFTFRPGTNDLWLGDVGWNAREEINRIPSLASSVTNFGWPCYEGTGHQDGYDGFDLNLCEDLYDDPPGAVTDAYFSYAHGDKVVPGEPCPMGTSSLSGLAFYEGGEYPDEYDGALFFSDYSRDCVWVMFPGGDGLPDPGEVETFVPEAANPVDLQIGPNDDLFYVDFDGGTIRRIQIGPKAVATAAPTEGTAPLPVQFDGTGSTDGAGGNDLTWEWDFDGDGAFDDATGPTPPTHTYGVGTHTAKLLVTDGESGDTDESLPITISAGNTSPTAVIDTPSSATPWRVGDTISFSGHATDPQQGDLLESALSWDLKLHHCPSTCHEHDDLGSWSGVESESFSAPDHEYPSHLELTLTATDAGGLSDTDSVLLDPETVDLSFHSTPNGLDLTVGSKSETTPFSQTVIVGSQNSISAPSPQNQSGTTWEWASWSDGGDRAHLIVAPGTPTTYTAAYRVQGAAAPNAAPTATIDAPAPSATWAVGKPVAFSGHATDPQEGELPPSALSWRVLLHNCGSCPARTVHTWTGSRNGSFIPPPAPAGAYVELELSAIDSQGSSGSTTLRLDPKVVRVAVATKPAGLDATIGSPPREPSATRSVVAGSEVKIRAPKSQRARGMRFRFQAWSDDGARIHEVVARGRTPILVAKYRCVPGPGENHGDCRRAISDLKRTGRQPS